MDFNWNLHMYMYLLAEEFFFLLLLFNKEVTDAGIQCMHVWLIELLCVVFLQSHLYTGTCRYSEKQEMSGRTVILYEPNLLLPIEIQLWISMTNLIR